MGEVGGGVSRQSRWQILPLPPPTTPTPPTPVCAPPPTPVAAQRAMEWWSRWRGAIKMRVGGLHPSKYVCVCVCHRGPLHQDAPRGRQTHTLHFHSSISDVGDRWHGGCQSLGFYFILNLKNSSLSDLQDPENKSSCPNPPLVSTSRM